MSDDSIFARRTEISLQYIKLTKPVRFTHVTCEFQKRIYGGNYIIVRVIHFESLNYIIVCFIHWIDLFFFFSAGNPT